MARYLILRSFPVRVATGLLLALSCILPAMAADQAPLAIKGYDTVAYFTDGKPTPGKPEFEYEWDEQRYRFASAEHLASFRMNPGRYMPRFGNICAGALAYGLAWEANPELWKLHEGKLYLFGSPASRDDFEKDPRRMISAAERNAERLRKGQPLTSGLPFPAEVVAEVTNLGRQCRVDPRPANCPPEAAMAEFERLVRTAPKQ